MRQDFICRVPTRGPPPRPELRSLLWRQLATLGYHASDGLLFGGMLEKARARGVYDQLITADILQALPSMDRSFSVVTCSVALYHWADLTPFFDKVTNVLLPDGHLIFSVDPVNDELDIGQTAPGEYAHSRAYIRRVTADAGLREISITIDVHRSYPGFWCVFQRLA